MRDFRRIGLPASWLYGGILRLRNLAYERGILRSHRPTLKTIAVGNLALGGTGKTPHVEYLIDFLKDKRVAVLSRGYGRLSKGTIRVRLGMKASEAGDEPLQMAEKFPDVSVFCDANRGRGLDFIAVNHPEVEIVLLDDALQHRKIVAGINVLLTTWDTPFTRDHILPAGSLRDHPVRARDADVIVVTKTPPDADTAQKAKITAELKKFGKPVVFSTVKYGGFHRIDNSEEVIPKKDDRAVLISGIAKPEYFENAVARQYTVEKHFKFRDHHSYTSKDIQAIRDFIGSFVPPINRVITTEKDSMRLKPFTAELKSSSAQWIYWEIAVDFGEDKTKFEKLISDYVDKP